MRTGLRNFDSVRIMQAGQGLACTGQEWDGCSTRGAAAGAGLPAWPAGEQRSLSAIPLCFAADDPPLA